MNNKKVLGIDLGGTSIKFGIVHPQGEVQTKWSIETDRSEQGSKIVPDIIQSIHQQFERLNLTANDFLGIGMGSPGTVNRKKGSVIGAYNLNWKTSQNLKGPIESEIGLPFFIDNDANVAAMGEQWLGAGNNEANIVFVTLGTGVGGGLISDGKLLHGATGAAGEIGHITVEVDGYRCTCGKRGCLEQYASATGIVRLARDLYEEHIGPSKLKNEIDVANEINSKMIFDYAKENDSYALLVVDRFVSYLSFALGNVANLLNPSTIVLGGGVSKAGDFLLKKVRAELSPLLFETIREITKVEIAELGSDAGMIGAASLVLNQVE